MGTARRRRRRAAHLVRWTAVSAVIVAFFATAWSLRGEPEVYIRDDAEALARVIRSEVGTSALQHRVHVAWATRNLAAARKQGVAAMACSPCGPQQAGRPVSSRQA